MASGKSTHEYLTIRRNLSLIVDGLVATVDPARLALKLHEANLITWDTVDRACVQGILTSAQRIQPLIMATEAQIQLDASKFQVLIAVLEAINTHLAENLQHFYASDLELNVVDSITDVDNWELLAFQLDFDPVKLQELQTSNRNPDHCKKEMLTLWAKNDERACWEKLVEALNQMQQHSAVKRIREEFMPARGKQELTEKKSLQETKLSAMSQIPTPAMQRYGEYLRRVYARQVLPCENKYKPKSTQKYINLTMISKYKESRAELDAFTKATIIGNIDDVIETKIAITLQDIGQLEDGSSAQCILVQGGPGVGKTTLAWEICHQWGKGSLLQHYSLVILLKMRDQCVREAKILSDLFRYPDPELQATLYKDIVQNNGNSVLMLLEGYDELPPEVQVKSPLADLIEGKVLPEATILITTRTSSSDIVFEKCKATKFQHIEVVGFTKEQIDSYINDVLSDQEVLRDFRYYLEKFPHIHGLMHVPLNCGIVLDVYTSRSSNDKPPKTQTELYTALTKTLLCRYLSSHQVHGTQKLRISNFSDLPADTSATFIELCKIAYQGIVSNQQIFSNMPTNQETLGLMQAVPELYGSEESSATSHNFLHLTLQEFLSAVHISSFSQQMLVKTLESFFGKKHLVIVLRFLAGLTKLEPQQTGNPSVIGKASSFFRKSPVRYVKSLQQDAMGFIETLHWLFEAQEKELLLQVLGRRPQDRNLSSQTLSPFDCYALGYCIANSECNWTLNLRSTTIDEEGMTMMADNCNGRFRNVAVLDLIRNGIATKGAAALSSALRGNMVLTELRLGLCGIGNEGTTSLTETLRNIPTLRVLDLSGNVVPSTAIKDLSHILSNCLTELNLGYCNIESSMVCDLTEALHENCCLQKLWLRGNPIGEAGGIALAHVLEHNSCLQSLDLTGCVSMGEVCVQKLIRAVNRNVSLEVLQLPDKLLSIGTSVEGYDRMQHRVKWTSDISTQEVVELADVNPFTVSSLRWNSVLTKLKLNGVDTEEMVRLAGVLNEISTLKSFELCACMINFQCAQHLATAFGGSIPLTDLKLYYCTVDESAMVRLQVAISTFSTLRILNLTGLSFGPDGAKHLSTALVGNTALTDLLLQYCCIDGTTMAELQDVLSTMANLRVLDLCGNILGSDGARHLTFALRGHSSLTCLKLSYCGIDGKGMVHLQEAISTIPSLRFLDLSMNTLDSEGTKHLVTAIRARTNLTDLHLQYCDINGPALTELLEAISSIPTLSNLDLTGNTLGIDGAISIGTALMRNNTLTDLKLWCCDIDGAAMAQLQRAISSISTLMVLNLADNPLGSEGAGHLAAAIRMSKSLTDLNLRGCSINRAGMAWLQEAIATISTLKILDLGCNPIGLNGARQLAAALKRTNTLTDLKLEQCGIKEERKVHIGKEVSATSTVDFAGNTLDSKEVTNPAMVQLQEAISTTPSLRILDLTSDSLDSENTRHCAMVQLQKAISTTTILRVLDLSGNTLNLEGARILATSLKGNKSLTDLALCYCGIDGAAMAQLQEAISSISSLRVLDLTGNNLGLEGAKHLATILVTKNTLTALILEQCGIDGAALAELQEALSNIFTLRILDLSWNTLGSEGTWYLVELMRTCHNLSELNLQWCDLGDSLDVTRLIEALSGNATQTTLMKLTLPWRYMETVTSAGVYSNVRDRLYWL